METHVFDKSTLVREMIKLGKRNRRDVAEILGISFAYFNNKLFRKSFSFEDIVTIADYCNLFLSYHDKVLYVAKLRNANDSCDIIMFKFTPIHHSIRREEDFCSRAERRTDENNVRDK